MTKKMPNQRMTVKQCLKFFEDHKDPNDYLINPVLIDFEAQWLHHNKLKVQLLGSIKFKQSKSLDEMKKSIIYYSNYHDFLLAPSRSTAKNDPKYAIYLKTISTGYDQANLELLTTPKLEVHFPGLIQLIFALNENNRYLLCTTVGIFIHLLITE